MPRQLPELVCLWWLLLLRLSAASLMVCCPGGCNNFVFIILDISLVLLGDRRISSWVDHYGGGDSLGELSRSGNILLDWTERRCKRGNLEMDGKSPECKLHQLVAWRRRWWYWQQLCFQILWSLINGLGWLHMWGSRMAFSANTCTVWILTVKRVEINISFSFLPLVLNKDGLYFSKTDK